MPMHCFDAVSNTKQLTTLTDESGPPKNYFFKPILQPFDTLHCASKFSSMVVRTQEQCRLDLIGPILVSFTCLLVADLTGC